MPIGLDESKRYDGIRKAFVQWYRQRAAQRLPQTVELWRKRMGWPEAPGVLVRDQRQRWGSCAPDGTLRFNWRVVMLQPELAEYVVVHELAHLKVSSDSAEYWAQVSGLLPDAQQRRQRLREAGKMLPIWKPQKRISKRIRSRGLINIYLADAEPGPRSRSNGIGASGRSPRSVPWPHPSSFRTSRFFGRLRW